MCACVGVYANVSVGVGVGVCAGVELCKVVSLPT